MSEPEDLTLKIHSGEGNISRCQKIPSSGQELEVTGHRELMGRTRAGGRLPPGSKFKPQLPQPPRSQPPGAGRVQRVSTAGRQVPFCKTISSQATFSALCLGQLSKKLFFFTLISFICFRLCWVFVAVQAFSSCSMQASPCGASLAVQHGLRSAGSVAAAHRLSRTAACGIFLDRGSNPCCLRWQVDP